MREFDAGQLLTLLSLAVALWNKYAPGAYQDNPDEEAFVRVLNGIKTEMRELSGKLIEGDISRAEWELDFERYVDVVYILSAAVLVGSFELTEASLSLGSEEWRTQNGFACDFEDELVDGSQRLDGTLVVRVGLYASAGWAIWQALRGILAPLLGAVEEERQLGSADHCDDCVEEAGKGRQPIGTLRKIGDSVCLTNCHCTFIYYDINGNVVEV